MNINHLVCAALACISSVANARAADPVNFQAEIAPLLVQRCLGCHGEQKFRGEYQLHSLAAMFKAGASGTTAIVPGKPAASYLLQLVREADADERMPKDADKLTDGEIALLERWITEGASFGDAPPEASLVNTAQWKHPIAPDKYRRPFPITALAFDPSGKELAVGGYHEVTIWNVADGTLLRRLSGLGERTYSVAYTRDGSKLVVAGGTPARLGEVKLLSAADGTLVWHFGSFTDCALSVALSPDEQHLAIAGADNMARVIAMATGKEELRVKDHSDWIMSVCWSPDGRRIATASRDKTCKVFDATSGELVTTFAEHGEPVLSITYHSDGKHAISAGADSRIRYWIADDPGWENAEKMDKKKRHQIGEIGGFNGPVQRLAAVDGRLFACSSDKSVRQFELEKRSSVRSFAGHQEALFATDYHVGTRRLATAGLDGHVRIWDTETKDEKALVVATFIAAPGYQPPAAETASVK